MSTVLWKDTKNVRLASTYVGIETFQREVDSQPSKAPRYDRKKKQYIEVDCPQIIREYNNHMGGVDLMDGLMGRYHIRLKTHNLMLRLFYHLIDMSLTNAYILHRRIHANSKSLLQLPRFREEVASGLCKYTTTRPVGRPSSQVSKSSSSDIGKKSLGPPDDVRFDTVDHMPGMHDKSGKRRCKQCKQSDTQIYCKKCNLNLCITPAKNCFEAFHSSSQ